MAKKPQGGITKKTEGETSVVMSYHTTPIPILLLPDPSNHHFSINHNLSMNNLHRLKLPRINSLLRTIETKGRDNKHQEGLRESLTPIHIPHGQLLTHFLNDSLVQLREARPPPKTLSPGYDMSAKCEYHSGTPGHAIENCNISKHKVQDLIDSNTITFTPNGLNIMNNLMPPHAGTTMMP